MECPKCHEPTDDGAAFCGNCGQPLREEPGLVNVGNKSKPAYTVDKAYKHLGETRAIIAVCFGVFGIASVYILPLLSLILGGLGLGAGFFNRRSAHKKLALMGAVLSLTAVIVGIIDWKPFYDHRRNLQLKNTHTISNNTELSATVETPCYNLGLQKVWHLAQDPGSCDIELFDGQTPAQSKNIYKIYANQQNGITKFNFADISQKAILKDLKQNLPQYTVQSASEVQFAGAQTYRVSAENSDKTIRIAESTTLHKTSAGYNLFVLVHLTTGTPDLSELEAQWTWN